MYGEEKSPRGATEAWCALAQTTARPDAAARRALITQLSSPTLREDIAAALHRFDTGADPEPLDEPRVTTLVRARAVLARSSIDLSDSLARELVALDRLWEPLRGAIWILDEAAWAAAFAPEPPLRVGWWEERLAAPSEAAVLHALRLLGTRTLE